MKSISTFLLFVLALTILGFSLLNQPQSADAVGHVGVRNVVPELRTRSTTYQYDADMADATTGAGSTIGVGGKVFTVAAAASYTVTTASSFIAPPHPCKLKVSFLDASADSTPGGAACVIAVTGRNQFGTPISDTFSAVLEVPILGARVFEKVTSLISSGTCSAGNAGDFLIVGCDDSVGLPFKLDTSVGVQSFCRTNAAGTTTTCATAAAIATAFDADDESIDTTDLGTTSADGDIMVVRVRSPAGL